MERLLEWYLRMLAELAALGRWLEGCLPAPNASQRGAGILEYCLIAAVVAIGLLAALNAFTGALSAVFARIVGRLAGMG